MSWLSRLTNAFRPDRLDGELEEELRFHLETRAKEAIRRGMNPQDAAREARLRLGNPLHTRETSRDARLIPWLESLLKDVRFGFRMLRKDSAVTAAALASLALAIGASLAAFALVDALLLRPLPVYQPDRLVRLTTTDESDPHPNQTFNYPLFERCRLATRGQVELFAMTNQFPEPVEFAKSGGREEQARVQYVSGNALPSLGIRPALGRLLTPSDDLRPGAHPVAVASYNFWMRRFGGDPSILGQWFSRQWFSDGTRQFQIVGVTEKGFTGVEPGISTDLWVPTMMWWNPKDLSNSGTYWFSVLGRLRPGVTAEAVRPALQAVYTNFLREQATGFRADESRTLVDRFLRGRLHVLPAPSGPSRLRETFARPLWILAAVAGLLLLIACSNLANLFTARALAREREMALRISIGAGRARLMRQLLVEGLLLASAASLLAAAFAAIAAPAIVGLLSKSDNQVCLDLHPDWRMTAFLLLACATATLLFALLPALRASAVSPHEALKSGGSKQSAQTNTLRPMLAAQIAFSFVVLFVGGLLLLSFRQLTHVDLGFDRNGVVLIDVRTTNPDIFATHTPAGRIAALQLLDRVRELPGVRNAAMCEFGFFTGSWMTENVRVPGRAPGDDGVNAVPVSPGFLETMGVRLLEGCSFTPRDVTSASSVVLVNQAFARRYYPGEDPIGKRFAFAEKDRDLPQDIIGVVQDVRLQSVRDPAPPNLFEPMRALSGTLAVRTDGDPWRVVPLVRQQIRSFGHSLRDGDVTLQSTLVDDALVRERLLALLAGFFALAAVALAGVGLYGVLSYSVLRRTKEIGIRMALGAKQASVVRLVIREIVTAAAIGLAAGLVLGRLLARPMESLLYEVKASDFWSLALPVALLLAAATLAALRPAWRAAKVEPAVALRNE
ncbi:MAG: ADOP family duplicated permease [Bryobacteraceae bacterium]